MYTVKIDKLFKEINWNNFIFIKFNTPQNVPTCENVNVILQIYAYVVWVLCNELDGYFAYKNELTACLLFQGFRISSKRNVYLRLMTVAEVQNNNYTGKIK